MRALLFLLLALCGCSTMACVSTTVPIYLADNDTPENRELVESAVESYLWMGVEFTDRSYGSIILQIRQPPEDSTLLGRSFHNVGCRYRYAWSVPRDYIIAHEVAHALGLRGHVKDPDNLMFPIPKRDSDLTQKQLNKIDRVARRLSLCVP